MVPFKLRLFIFIILLAGCAGNPLVKKEKQYLRSLKTYPLVDKKGQAFSKVRAFEKPVLQEIKTGGYRIEVPIDSKNSIRCTLKDKYSPSSLWMANFIDKLRSKVSHLGILHLDAGVIKKWPYLYSEVAFSSNGKKTRNSVLKVLSLSRGEGAILCLQDAGKGQGGLKEVAGDIISSLRKDEKYKTSFLSSQVDITSVKKFNMGFVHREVFKNKKGNLVSIVRTSMIIPKNNLKNSLKGLYDISIEVSDKKGVYLEGSYLGYENLKQRYKMKVRPLKGKKYELTGSVNKKKIKKSLSVEGNLMTAVGQDLFFEGPKNRTAKTLTFYDYVPSINPLKILKSKLVYKGLEETGLNLYSVELNKSHLDLKVDSKGTPIFSSSKFGNVILENRRVYLEKKRF